MKKNECAKLRISLAIEEVLKKYRPEIEKAVEEQIKEDIISSITWSTKDCIKALLDIN